eukprot:scaffold90636_cov74-Phaeocystis_antarctica.AAC.1
MKILHFCTLARSDPPRLVKGSCSHFCAHTATLGFSTRAPLAPASEAHAANSEGEDSLAGEGSPVPPWLSRRSKSMGRADWHARIIRTDSSALSIVCRCAAGARARAAIRRRPLYFMRSIEASSSSVLSCDSILSEACLRSSALKRSRNGSQRTASGLLEPTPATARAASRGAEPRPTFSPAVAQSLHRGLADCNPRRSLRCRTRFKTAIAAARPFLGLCPSPLLWLKALDALYNFPAAGKVVGGKPGAR